jgi:hypothetical protein
MSIVVALIVSWLIGLMRLIRGRDRTILACNLLRDPVFDQALEASHEFQILLS